MRERNSAVVVAIAVAASIMASGCGGARDDPPPQPLTSQVKARALAIGSSGSSSSAGSESTAGIDATELLNWAELAYPQFFPGHEENLQSSPYVYRHYKQTGNYVGVDGQFVRILGPFSGNIVTDVGTLEDFACQVRFANCVAPAVKSSTADLLAPAGATVSFGALVEGGPSISYQWYKNGTAIEGANASTIQVSNVALGDDGAQYKLRATNAKGSSSSSGSLLRVTPKYWLWGQAGLDDTDPPPIYYGNTFSLGQRYALMVVDPDNPRYASVIEPKSWWLLLALVKDHLWQNGEIRPDSSKPDRLVLYARDNRLRQLDLRAAQPVSVAVSTQRLREMCLSGANDWRLHQDGVDTLQSVLSIRVAGTDRQCDTADDGFVAIRLNSSDSQAPVVAPQLVAAIRGANGAMVGFIGRQGDRIQRLDANFGKPVDLAVLTSPTVKTLLEPTLDSPRWVYKDGNEVRSIDVMTPGSGRTLVTVSDHAVLLGSVGTTARALIYFSDDELRACLDTGCETGSTRLAELPRYLSWVPTATADRDGMWVSLVPYYGALGSRVIRIRPDLTLESDVSVGDSNNQIRRTPRRFTYNANDWPLRQVSLAGGPSRSLLPAEMGAIGWHTTCAADDHISELYWVEGRAADQPDANAVRSIRLDGSVASTYPRTKCLMDAENSNGSEMLLLRDFDQYTSAGLSGGTLVGANRQSGNLATLYGAMPWAYSTVDMVGRPNHGAPILLRVSGTSSGMNFNDLLFIRVGQPGLIQSTSFRR